MQVETSYSGAVATVTLNRPERMNALTKEMREELIEAFQSLRFNDDVRAVILTANGTNFCAGADIDRMAEDDLRARPFQETVPRRRRAQPGGLPGI